MKSPLNILQLEDDPNDAELVRFTLEKNGIICVTTRVENRQDFVTALEDGLGIDLILSDFSLPSFDGLSAMRLAHTRWPELPFILVSGTLGEEQAVESLKSGATDYILKGGLGRLGPAVRRAMIEVEERADRRRLEAQFIEAQKMEVVGQLASGVAHDFNNILAIIMFSSELMSGDLAPDSPLRQYTEEIRLASERAAGLTRQLLLFSSKQTVHAVVLDLNDTIEDQSKMLRRLVDENIEVLIVPGKPTGRIRADSGYIGQVLMNLIVNARDAMPNGGKITIATSNITLDAAYAGTHPGVIPGDYVMLCVSDTGTGMTPETKARLFEAFFTTKPKGKGTGLGLATCHAIVQQSGGHIGVHSEVGKGTTFNIYFPQVDQPLHIAAGSIRSGQLPRGTETLLVVEDEPSVRYLACGVLESLGYKVLAASNGHEALRAAHEYAGSPIRLVLTDVIMPHMGGVMMAAVLKTTHPDLQVLFTSGYTDDAVVQQGLSDPDASFLPKPFTPGILARRVRQMLDGARST